MSVYQGDDEPRYGMSSYTQPDYDAPDVEDLDDDQDFTAPFRLTVGAGGCRRAEEAGSEVESWEGGW